MGEVTAMIVIVVFLAIIVLSGRFFYLMNLKSVTNKLVTSLHFDALAINYSFEQMVYFHPLPSNIPTIKYATRENISIEYDYKVFFTQYLRGVSVYIKNDEQKILLAYLATNDLRFPTLDSLMKQEKLDEESYFKVAAYRLTHPQTLQELTDEVYHQMITKRYEGNQTKAYT